ncbi:MAG: aldose epimerase family protein [Acutalibacteraceae bacterium]|nr:galactose mutarotase [Oscillospiraceae bacterium]
MSVRKEFYGETPDGKKIYEYTIENRNGVSVSIINYGATMNRILCPDKNGEFADILVGFDSLEGHMANPGYFCGQTVGQYANRIENGRFSVSGTEYHVTQNEKGKTCLHGGSEYSHAVWKAIIVDDDCVEFSYLSPDGEQGFPGNVDVKVVFSLSNDNTIQIDYKAVSDKDTVINLTNHAYFNLGTTKNGDVLGHELTLDCDYYTPTDADSIPTGEIRSVEGTAFDFRQGKPIGKDIGADDEQLIMCGGYDHNFCINGKAGELRRFAHVFDPASGRTLDCCTDLPGVQLYTGNFMSTDDVGKDGVHFDKHYAFCLETQFYPNTPNTPEFPQCTFKAGEEFVSTTQYKVGRVVNDEK